MTRPPRLPWDEAQDDHLLFLRDREKLRFNEIGPRLGRSPEACEVRYYTDLFALNAANHYGKARSGGRPIGGGTPRLEKPAPTPSPKSSEPLPDDVAPAAPATSMPCANGPSCARAIAERGLTGGVLGDPPPGRSALDQRTLALRPK